MYSTSVDIRSHAACCPSCWAAHDIQGTSSSSTQESYDTRAPFALVPIGGLSVATSSYSYGHVTLTIACGFEQVVIGAVALPQHGAVSRWAGGADTTPRPHAFYARRERGPTWRRCHAWSPVPAGRRRRGSFERGAVRSCNENVGHAPSVTRSTRGMARWDSARARLPGRRRLNASRPAVAARWLRLNSNVHSYAPVYPGQPREIIRQPIFSYLSQGNKISV